jgi:hypothetical protein
MITGHPLKMNPDIRKYSLLIFIDLQIFEGSSREVMPTLTSQGTGSAA